MGKTSATKGRDRPCQLEGQMTIDDVLVPLGEPPTCVLETPVTKAGEQ